MRGCRHLAFPYIVNGDCSRTEFVLTVTLNTSAYGMVIQANQRDLQNSPDHDEG